MPWLHRLVRTWKPPCWGKSKLLLSSSTALMIDELVQDFGLYSTSLFKVNTSANLKTSSLLAAPSSCCLHVRFVVLDDLPDGLLRHLAMEERLKVGFVDDYAHFLLVINPNLLQTLAGDPFVVLLVGLVFWVEVGISSNVDMQPESL